MRPFDRRCSRPRIILLHAISGLVVLSLACAPSAPGGPTSSVPAQPAVAPTTAPAAAPGKAPGAAEAPKPAAAQKPSEAPKLVDLPVPAAAPAGRSGGQLITMTMGVVPNINGVPMFVAIEKGFFNEHGLDIKLKTGASGPALNTALNSGDIQVATSNFEPLITSIANGGTGMAVAFIQNDPSKLYPDDQTVMITAKPEIKTIADLVGKRIGAVPGGIFITYTEKVLRAAGIDPKTVEIVPVQNYSDIQGAITRGGLDAGTFSEPYGVQMLLTNPNARELSRGGGYVLSRVTLTAKRDWVPANRDTLERFAAALAQSSQFIRQRPDEAAEITTHWLTGMTVPVIREAFKYVRYDPRLSDFVAQSWEYENNNLLQANRIKQRVPMSEGFDTSLVELLVKKYPQYFSDLKPLS